MLRVARSCVVTISIALASIHFSPLLSSVHAQPAQYFAGTGHWYQAIWRPGASAWSQCRDSAYSLGGYLASIHSQSENDFVTGLAPSLADDGAFLGGTDEMSEGTWNWVSGEAWTYEDWCGGTPPGTSPSEDYLMIGGGSPSDCWYNRSDTTFDNWFVVEYEHSPCYQPLTPQYYGATGHWYQVVSAECGITWTAARDSADALGGHLVTIESTLENEFLLNQLTYPGQDIWIGGFESSEGVWVWVTSGEFWNQGPTEMYSNWYPNEPNNTPPGPSYAQLHTVNYPNPGDPPYPGYWNDMADNPPNNPNTAFVVEYESSPFCDGFEDPASLSNWHVRYNAQLVNGPTHTGSSAAQFGGISGNCEGIMRRKNFAAAYGEYGAYFRQDNVQGGPALYTQLQAGIDDDPYAFDSYRLGSDADGSVNSVLQLVRRFPNGSYNVLGAIQPVPYSVGDWVRIFVRRFGPDSLEFGYVYNGLIVTEQCVDPDPILAPGGFALSSCSDGGAANYVDDVCYFPYQIITDTLTEVVTDTLCEAISACGTTQEDVDNSGAADIIDVTRVINAAFRGQAETLDSCTAVAKP